MALSVCDLCGGVDCRRYLSGTSLRPLAESDFSVLGERGECPPLVRCTGCGLIFVHPRDEERGLRQKYEELVLDGYLMEEGARRATARRDAALVRQFVKSGRFLDVGCSAGLFLDSLGPGLERYGIELGRSGAQKAAQLIGRDRVFQGRFEEARHTAGSFAGISFWDVLEHLISPKDGLKRAASLLIPGGYVFAVVPDIGSPFARMTGQRWPHLIRSHLFYFTKETIARLFETAGFRVCSTGSYARLFTVRYIFERLGFAPAALDGRRQRQGWRGPVIPVNTFDSLLVVGQKK